MPSDQSSGSGRLVPWQQYKDKAVSYQIICHKSLIFYLKYLSLIKRNIFYRIFSLNKAFSMDCLLTQKLERILKYFSCFECLLKNPCSFLFKLEPKNWLENVNKYWNSYRICYFVKIEENNSFPILRFVLNVSLLLTWFPVVSSPTFQLAYVLYIDPLALCYCYLFFRLKLYVFQHIFLFFFLLCIYLLCCYFVFFFIKRKVVI